MSRTGNQFRLQGRHGDQDDNSFSNEGQVVAWQSKKNRRGSGRPQTPALNRRQVRLALQGLLRGNLALPEGLND